MPLITVENLKKSFHSPAGVIDPVLHIPNFCLEEKSRLLCRELVEVARLHFFIYLPVCSVQMLEKFQ